MGCQFCRPLLDNEPNQPLRAGFDAYHQGDYQQALQLLLPFAHAGQPVAQCLIASLYHAGFGVAPDQSAALNWYSLAATQGCGLAWNNIAAISATKSKINQQHIDFCFRKARECGFDMLPPGY